MRTITTAGLNLIKHFEKFVPYVYRCPSNYLTIGFGHLVRKEEMAKFANGITEEEALQILAQDVRVAERKVLSLIRVPLNDNQFSSLVSFTFNLGSGSLQRSTLRAKVNRSEHDDVPQEFMRWVYAGRFRLKGLITRRAAEANLYMS